SRRSSAYDDWDLQLLTAIANEASIALERANLYERTAMLSRRLFELHRVGLAIAERTELVDVTRLLAESVVGLLKPAVCAIYLDKGGDTLDFAFSTGKPASDVLALPKNTPLMARVLESGQPVALAQRDDAPENARKLLERFGHEALLVHPLRSADQTVGVLFVTWREAHLMTDDERELIGILAGVGASTIRSIRLYRELDDAYLSTVSTLMSTIVARDHYREDHQRKIAADAVAMGERLELSENELRDLRYASLFHSLGKIGVPAAILSKAGPLTPEEKKIMQEHPILGALILESIRFLTARSSCCSAPFPPPRSRSSSTTSRPTSWSRVRSPGPGRRSSRPRVSRPTGASRGGSSHIGRGRSSTTCAPTRATSATRGCG